MSGQGENDESLSESGGQRAEALGENAVMTSLLHQCAALGNNNTSPDPPQLSESDKKFLEDAIKSCSTAIIGEKSNGFRQLLQSIDSWATKTAIPITEENFEELSQLEELTEEMNAGDDFIAANGLALCEKLLNIPNDTVRLQTCSILANVALNNPTFHGNPRSHGIIFKLFGLYSGSGGQPSVKLQLKYLSAASCIFAGNQRGMKNFLVDPSLGQGLLYKHYWAMEGESEGVVDVENNLRLQQRLGGILDKFYTDIDDPRLLTPALTQDFVRTLLDKWFELEELKWTHLTVLQSIIGGKNSAVSRSLIEQFGDRFMEILKRLKDSSDAQENGQLIQDFEKKLEEVKNIKILSICN